jgi:predicted membrane protein
MSKHVTTANSLSRAQRELKMVRRIVILIIGLTTIGFPYALFVFISFFTSPPKYAFRIAYIFINVSSAFVMVALFQFTDPLKTSIMKKITRRRNTILPAVT